MSTAADDASAAFSVREIIPFPVSGVVSADGDPLPGVPVNLHVPGGGTLQTTTDANGAYLFDDNDVADGYFVTIDVPDGYSGMAQRPPFDIVDQPVTSQDFALTANADISGTISGGGGGLGGVTVTLQPDGGGPEVTTVSAADGTYSFERVPPGTYDIAIDTPSGYTPAPPRSGVVLSDEDVIDQDFDLGRNGAIGGTVHLDTANGPVQSGVTIEITGPGGTRTLTSDGEGNFFVDGLLPGDYEIHVVLPDGFTGVGPVDRTVTITADGEIRGGQDFVITERAALPPSPTPTEDTPTDTQSESPNSGSNQDGEIPEAGSTVSLPLVFLGVALVGLGGSVMYAANRRKIPSQQAGQKRVEG